MQRLNALDGVEESALAVHECGVAGREAQVQGRAEALCQPEPSTHERPEGSVIGGKDDELFTKELQLRPILRCRKEWVWICG
jgi:hypothetical protein